MKRVIFCILGLISLILGCIGIVLPVIPTVPFLLLTSYFFSRGSKRFDNWFKNSKIYKKYLENFVKNKVMTLKGEILLLGLVTTILVTLMWRVNNIYMSICLLALIICKYLYFFLCIETVSKEEYLRRSEMINAG